MSFPLALAPSGAGLVGNLSFDSEQVEVRYTGEHKEQFEKSMKKTIITIFSALFIFCFAVNAHAITVTWTGGGIDELASNPANWSGGIVPQNGDDVVFDGTSIKDCTLDIYVVPASLSLNSGYTGTLLTNSDLIITGNLDVRDGT